MSMTPSPQDKLAFLFSGKTDNKSLNNLKQVYQTLRTFCNYPDTNIKMCIGGPDTTGILAGCMYSTVASESDFRDNFYAFADQVCSRNPATITNPVNTLLIYFTGEGSGDGSGSYSYTIFESTPTPGTVNETVLNNALRGKHPSGNPALTKNYFLNSYVHFLFDFDSSGVFDPLILGLNSTDHCGSMTFSCASGQTSPVDLSGASIFTYHWCRAFKMVPYTTGGTDYADTLTVTGESSTNELVSLQKACAFGKLAISDLGVQTPVWTMINTSDIYLGLPWLVIRDGSPYIWQSPDIRLYHPSSVPPYDELPDVAQNYIDDYEMDDPSYSTIVNYVFKNHIHVNIWNFGTHPVFHLKTNFILYDTGCSGTGTSLTAPNNDNMRSTKKYLVPVPSTSTPAISITSDSEDPTISFITGIEYNFNQVPFLSALHRCIRAKTALGTAADPDVTVWDFANIDAEAQRNINNGAISDKKSEGRKEEREIKGFSRKRFVVENPFKHRLAFRIVDIWGPKLNDLIAIDVFRNGTRTRRIDPIELDKEIRYRDVTLGPGEKAEYIVEVTNKVDIQILKTIDLNFEIMVADRRREIKLPGRTNPKMPGFVTIAGFTIVLKVSNANLNIQITDEKGKIAPLTPVILETLDGLQRAELKTDKEGILKVEGFNPAKYKITVLGKNGKEGKPFIEDFIKTPDKIMRVKVKKSFLG
jgi:hypothetical protein